MLDDSKDALTKLRYLKKEVGRKAATKGNLIMAQITKIVVDSLWGELEKRIETLIGSQEEEIQNMIVTLQKLEKIEKKKKAKDNKYAEMNNQYMMLIKQRSEHLSYN